MSLADALEQQLLKYWQSLETRKTWSQWMQWLTTQGISLPSSSPPPTDANQPITFQVFLRSCEAEVLQHPEWAEILASPEWLQAHNVTPLPTKISAHASLPTWEQQIRVLVQEIHQLQQRVTQLEARPTANSPHAPDSMPHFITEAKVQDLKATPDQGVSTGPAGLPHTQMLEKDLAVMQFNRKQRPPQESPPSSPRQQKLEDVYLPIQQWYEQFLEVGLDLQSFCSVSLQSQSSHRISFQQLGKRLERSVEDKAGFQKVLKQFEEKHHDGITITNSDHHGGTTETASTENSHEASSGNSNHSGDTVDNSHLGNTPNVKNNPTIQDEDNATGFSPPPSDLYQDFHSWLEWLDEKGVDVRRFTSQELSVPSSHRISFPQFCRRLERKLDDLEGFYHAIQA